MCGILHLVCAMVCIDYRYIKCWYSNDYTVITIPIIYIMGNDAVYVYIVCIVNQFDRFGLHLRYCNLYGVVNLLLKSGWQLSAACQSVLSVYWSCLCWCCVCCVLLFIGILVLCIYLMISRDMCVSGRLDIDTRTTDRDTQMQTPDNYLNLAI